jgi:hypothetical protein
MEAVLQLPAGVRLTLTTSASTIENDLQLTLIRQVPRDLRPAMFDLDPFGGRPPFLPYS